MRSAPNNEDVLEEQRIANVLKNAFENRKKNFTWCPSEEGVDKLLDVHNDKCVDVCGKWMVGKIGNGNRLRGI